MTVTCSTWRVPILLAVGLLILIQDASSGPAQSPYGPSVEEKELQGKGTVDQTDLASLLKRTLAAFRIRSHIDWKENPTPPDPRRQQQQQSSAFQCVPHYYDSNTGSIQLGPDYPSNLDYCYLIDIDGDIELTWGSEFGLERGGSWMDTIEVIPNYDVATGTSDYSSYYYGTNKPADGAVQGPLLIKFYSDEDTSGAGFHVEWQAVSSPAPPVSIASNSQLNAAMGCPVWTESNNIITMGDYVYEQDVCYVLPGERLRIDIVRLDIEYDAACAYDYIELIDRSGNSQRFCGGTPPRPVRMDGPVVFHFSADYDTGGSGYEITFRPIRNRRLR